MSFTTTTTNYSYEGGGYDNGNNTAGYEGYYNNNAYYNQGGGGGCYDPNTFDPSVYYANDPNGYNEYMAQQQAWADYYAAQGGVPQNVDPLVNSISTTLPVIEEIVPAPPIVPSSGTANVILGRNKSGEGGSTRISTWNPSSNSGYSGGYGGAGGSISMTGYDTGFSVNTSMMPFSSPRRVGAGTNGDNTVKPQCALISFGFGGKFVVMFPRPAQLLSPDKKSSSGGGENTPEPLISQPSGVLRKGYVYIATVCDLIANDSLVKDANLIAGPLLSCSPNEIKNLIDEKVAYYQGDTTSLLSQDSKILWQCMKLLLSNNGILREQGGEKVSQYLREVGELLHADQVTINNLASIPPPHVRSNKNEMELSR